MLLHDWCLLVAKAYNRRLKILTVQMNTNYIIDVGI